MTKGLVSTYAFSFQRCLLLHVEGTGKLRLKIVIDACVLRAFAISSLAPTVPYLPLRRIYY